MNEKTIFKKIIDGEIPAHKVYEDETVLAFLDAAPVNIGHTLVIPKSEHVNIYETPDDILAHMMVVAKKIAKSLKEKLNAGGVNIIMNNDDVAGQKVFHAHIHIVPRFEGDGHRHWFGARGYNAGEAEMVAEKISDSLNS
ncbi:MAG: HIT family protein [Candidatus Nomurabacteria bacterium]|nr:HIT family protein [Candidatus Nomurabacteria bacterium]